MSRISRSPLYVLMKLFFTTASNADPENRVFHLSQFQNESDERVVELQNMVQNVTHTEAEIQQMSNLLQELELSMNNSKQRQKEVRSECC